MIVIEIVFVIIVGGCGCCVIFLVFGCKCCYMED